MLFASIKTAKYLFVGLLQICWLVESLELAHGHRRSRTAQMPMDRAGQPLPWYTYPAIQYLNQLDLHDCDVFEFGSRQQFIFLG